MFGKQNYSNTARMNMEDNLNFLNGRQTQLFQMEENINSFQI
jgi:hypothetical protein